MINFASTLISLIIRGQGRHLFVIICVSETHILKGVPNFKIFIASHLLTCKRLIFQLTNSCAVQGGCCYCTMLNHSSRVIRIQLLSMKYVLFFYGRALQEEIEVSEDEHSQQLSATENVVRVRVLLDEFKPMMAPSIQELRRAGLKIDCFGLHEDADRTSSVALPSTLNKPLSCPITVLCNDICAAIKKLHFSVYRGPGCLQESARVTVHIQVPMSHEDLSVESYGE